MERKDIQTPDCCKKCSRLTDDGNCMNAFKKCYQWRFWFKKEWERIREATQKVRDEQSPTGKK